MVGFEHFYLYNNNSADDYLSALAPYRREGWVTLHDWPQSPAFPAADEHCIATHGHEARWIAFLDDDEFLYPVLGDDVRKVLRTYAEYPGFVVHWLMFGSSGHDRRPDGLVIENYVRRSPQINGHIKSIVDPRRVVSPQSTHCWIYEDGAFAVDENRKPVLTFESTPATGDVLRINHYWSKSREDGERKFSRGSVDAWGVENPRSMKFWEQSQRSLNAMEDREIQRFLPELKARLARRGRVLP